MSTIITYGTFDLFHVGHVRLLKRLSESCERLIVGCSTDEFNTLKGKKCIFHYTDRAEILSSCRYVDQVFPENSWEQKVEDIKKYNADIACLIEEVENPSQYGVVTGNILENGVIDIKEIIEKPKKPKSKNAVIAIYIFKPKIFRYLAQVKRKSTPQNQLSDAFELAIKKSDRMIGVVLKKNERRIDIGTPETYSKVLVSLK